VGCTYDEADDRQSTIIWERLSEQGWLSGSSFSLMQVTLFVGASLPVGQILSMHAFHLGHPL
jgi:hypothetical protein